MRACPLAGGVVIPCFRERPLCNWCDQTRAKGAPASLVRIAPANPELRVCIGCGAYYAPTGNHQQRCQSCRVKHSRMKNALYQQAFHNRRKLKLEKNHGLRDISSNSQ
jgi:hypothetical protein